MEPIARQALATGGDPGALARALADRLAGPDLRIAFVFADHRLDAAPFAEIQRALAAPVVGCSTVGVLGPGSSSGVSLGPSGGAPSAVALGLYGDWLRVGVGVASKLSNGALARSREAVHQAAAQLGTTVDALEPGRHVALSLFDGLGSHAEAFCIGSAAAAPKIRCLGGGASAELELDDRRSYVWANGVAQLDAGVVIVLDSDQPFHAVTSSHLVATDQKTVVTAATGRAISELDGRPAATRLRQLIAGLGDELNEAQPTHAFARYIDGVPYVRSLFRIAGERLILASAVEPGHVLRVMRPGDLVRTTQRDLATAAERVGGTMAAFLAFSCLARHTEAACRAGERELATTYAAYPMIGFHTVSEQSGMLLVNHTLTGLAIGALKS
ncbi:MAG TPA: FIST N-terminal domain-containing protein [Kofleriaceae bacterium]|nr:FIST N-terminal domain-containing protein [Kofleriaceae bacterium]